MPPLALTMGEPAGVGGEITLAAWSRRSKGVPTFLAVDDPDRLAALARQLGIEVPLIAIAEPEEAEAVFQKALPVLPCPLARPARLGVLDSANAPAVLASIETAVRLTREGRVAAVVTNPIHKRVLYDVGFPFPGHTEFLAALAGIATPPIMMLACPGLRVVPVTVHVSLRRAIDTLTTDAIVEAGRILDAALRRDFGIPRPRVAVAGLNPHAGEGGGMGEEEATIVSPAVERLMASGVAAFGPLPPDTLFTLRARAGYDAALCMYHDQALIPLKTLDFDGGVNVTLGLPFVRTSPDHGTALDIAGSGKADPGSLLAALTLARDMARRRRALMLP